MESNPRTRYGPLDGPSPEAVDLIPQDRTPGEITPEILAFCRQIDPTREPLIVPRRPAAGAASGSPFALLKDHVSRHGGGVQYGWAITEQPGWYLEAEFQAVWITPTGGLIDITPGPEGVGSLLFLPDSGRSFQGESLPNRFFALSTSPDVRAIVQDAEFHARLRADAETQARRERVRPGAVGRNDPCPCGSGLKYKKCCGRSGR